MTVLPELQDLYSSSLFCPCKSKTNVFTVLEQRSLCIALSYLAMNANFAKDSAILTPDTSN